ncbi:hypothetical protein [Paracoccus tibetensis]|uniref:Uncharacterized protein n=1 Tax=Paracoccus tibetensis TaxID=336292 RepID=A0A1G5FCD0_9RHOB|nr:hypothetical protein [Paracoccus tibetensis]SCY36909.1 hypothetical protein SAMN05660710_01357 [Paracoccus tibetensis]
MADANKTTSIAQRKLAAEAEAVLDQMYAYFTREERPRPVMSELDARRAA